MIDNLKVLSLFSGIGAFEKALVKLGVPHQVAAYCEIDPQAARNYSLIHNVPESLNLGDITKVAVGDIPSFDLVTYGFPCQDISAIGKQGGIKEGEPRSGLLFNALKIITHHRPPFALAENVKNLTSATFRSDLDALLETLDGLGYDNYARVLNARDYGVAQNHERIFIVSIRKDLKANFAFPAPFPTRRPFVSYLEEEAEERYFYLEATIGSALAALDWQALAPGKYAVIRNRGALFTREISNCIDASYWKGVDNHGQRTCVLERSEAGARVRRLTARETWRLMGFEDADFDACAKVTSVTQLYKQAGNSIVVDAVGAVLGAMFGVPHWSQKA